MDNFDNINFTEKIENYVPPPGRSLYTTRPRMRFNIKDSDIFDFIEECIKILVKKQQLK